MYSDKWIDKLVDLGISCKNDFAEFISSDHKPNDLKKRKEWNTSTMNQDIEREFGSAESLIIFFVRFSIIHPGGRGNA